MTARRTTLRALTIGAARHEAIGGSRRVTALVAGTPVSYESSDAGVVPAPEAFAGPLLLAAVERGMVLRFDEPPSATWVGNARNLVEMWRRWWGYRGPDPFGGVEPRPDAGPPLEPGAQCFSGGVDSFHTLLHSPHRRDVLLAIHGCDVALDDEARWAAFVPSLREVAAATGRRAVVLRTSVRRHPMLRRLSWDRAHGGVLAGAGHALTSTFGSLVIPASWSRAWPHGWGSHWDADPLWSSDRLCVVHDDATLERWDKLPGLLSSPLVPPHLRVCWEHRAPAGTCGVCEKCVRTRVLLVRHGLDDLGDGAFPRGPALLDAIDALVVNRKQLDVVWEPHCLRWSLSPGVHAAVARLVDRSRRALDAGPLVRLARRLRKSARHLRRLARRRLR